MSKTIEAKDVNVHYGKFLAVENVDMRIEANAVTAFIGPSGCGKTTFLRSLNRMIETIPGGRVTGAIRMDGVDILADGIDPVRSGGMSAWSSSDRTRSRR